MRLSKLFQLLAICAFFILLFLEIYNILNFKNSIQKIQEKNAQSLITVVSNSIISTCEDSLYNEGNAQIHRYDRIDLSHILERGFSAFSQSPSIAYILIENKDSIIAISNHSRLNDLKKKGDFDTQSNWQNKSNIRYISFDNKDVLEVTKPMEIPNYPSMVMRLGYNTQIYNSEYNRVLSFTIFGTILALLITMAILVHFATNTTARTSNNPEIALHNSLRDLFNSITDGVILLDKSKIIKYMNKSASDIFEIDNLSTINKNYDQFFNYDYFNLENVLKDGSPSTEMNVRLQTPRGSSKYLSYTSNLIKFSFDKSEWILIVFRDISEQVKLQEQNELQEKKDAIEEIASSISDRIKNPLNAIYQIINQMEQSRNADLNATSLKILKDEIKQINDIIEHFLEFAKPINLNLQKVNLSEIFDELALSFSKIIDAKNIALHKDYPSYIPLQIDPELINQSLAILIQNAVDSIENKGDIILNIKIESDKVIIRITDNGIGMSKAEMSKIFSVDFSSNARANTLALAKVEQIVLLHNGTISVDSSEKAGTTFEIILPNNNII